MSILDHLDRMNIAGETLRYVRTSHGLSAQLVADTASITRECLRDIETQNTRCTPTAARQITQAITQLRHAS
ncbi:helix-turn-helix domain-containing protein [Rhodococcoides fascians]|uniref:helix-turn-helix domain-containing protein n=1 Tax=Rhodococcoides fascians TaxID=1828 RepID=UPI00050C878B|nr:helix-turn-helix domain-containing protein [Rhodococcus fascians]